MAKPGQKETNLNLHSEVLTEIEDQVDNRLMRINDAAKIALMNISKSSRNADIVSMSIPSKDEIKYVLKVIWKRSKYLNQEMGDLIISILSGSHLFSKVKIVSSKKRQIVIEMFDDKAKLEELANLPFELAEWGE